jgi:hypothetical protein
VTARVAFLIGNQTFRPDSGLLPLQGPANDVAALARLLRDPERGNFEVHEFHDKTHHEILPELEQALSSAALGDLFLIYYSGHGKLARNGHLCLATADTHQSAVRATSIPTRHLRDLVEESDCDQVVLLLDCCYSGAVDDGLRGDLGSELKIMENAHGFYIITASTGMQTARETALSRDVVMGQFTAALVNGIESGAADRVRKGKILLSDLRDYLGHVAIGSTPQFFDRRASGDPFISFSPLTLPLLDPGVVEDLNAEQWHRRRGAVSALAGVLGSGDAAARAAARTALQHRLVQERDYSVRAELESALGLGEEKGPDISHATDPFTDTVSRPEEEVAASALETVMQRELPQEHAVDTPVTGGIENQPRETTPAMPKASRGLWQSLAQTATQLDVDHEQPQPRRRPNGPPPVLRSSSLFDLSWRRLIPVLAVLGAVLGLIWYGASPHGVSPTRVAMTSTTNVPAAPRGPIPAHLALSSGHNDAGTIITYSGTVHDEATRYEIIDSLKGVFGASHLKGDITVDANAGAAPWLVNLPKALGDMRNSGDVQVVFDGNSLNPVFNR